MHSPKTKKNNLLFTVLHVNVWDQCQMNSLKVDFPLLQGCRLPGPLEISTFQQKCTCRRKGTVAKLSDKMIQILYKFSLTYQVFSCWGFHKREKSNHKPLVNGGLSQFCIGNLQHNCFVAVTSSSFHLCWPSESSVGVAQLSSGSRTKSLSSRLTRNSSTYTGWPRSATIGW